MKALVRAYGGQVGNWSWLLPYVLWADLFSRAAIDWTGEMSREELLAARIRQLERSLEDVAREKVKFHTAQKKKDAPAKTEEDRGRRLGIGI